MSTIRPRKNDVLFGKGTAINSHHGNQRFRSLVEPQKINFRKAETRSEKHEIAHRIVAEIQESGGTFLMEDPDSIIKKRGGKTSGRRGAGAADATEENEFVDDPHILRKDWLRVGRERAIAKVMQCLREKIRDGGPIAAAKAGKKPPETNSLGPAEGSSSRAGPESNKKGGGEPMGSNKILGADDGQTQPAGDGVDIAARRDDAAGQTGSSPEGAIKIEGGECISPGMTIGGAEGASAISYAPGGETSGRSNCHASAEYWHQAAGGTEQSAPGFAHLVSLPEGSTSSAQPENNRVQIHQAGWSVVASARTYPGNLPVTVQDGQGAGTAVNQIAAQITPLDNDVLFGKGNAIDAHPGNRLFRAVIQEEKPKFLLSTKEKKKDFARKIVNKIQKLGGRFLMNDPDNDGDATPSKGLSREDICKSAWICVETEVAVGKVMSRLFEENLAKDVDPTEIDLQLPQACRLQQGMMHNQSRRPILASGSASHDSLPRSSRNEEASLSKTCSFYCLDSVKQIPGGFPVSIIEFIRSGYLSHRIMLTHEVQTTQESTMQQPHMFENAVRLSLVFTHFYVCHLPTINLESTELEDFVVSLDQDHGDEQAEGSSSMVSPNQCPKMTRLSVNMKVLARFEGLHDQNRFKVSAMQVLGRLLYSIFATGDSLPPNVLDGSSSQEEATLHASEEDVITELLTKSCHTSDKSIFSRLIEGDNFPAAICHFLSDLMGVGLGSDGGAPFTSFDEVVQDLEHMIRQPQIFLHDSGPTPHIVFGRSIYGREEEIATLSEVANRMMQEVLHQPANDDSPARGLEALFVSGIAGSGKSHLVQQVGETLSSSGWIVVKATFERGLEHTSRRVVSSMFDEVVKYLVKMKKSIIASDVCFSLRASKAVVDAIGYEELSSLVDFLPSLPLLLSSSTLQFDGTSSTGNVEMQEGDDWQLIRSLTKLLEAVLESDRFIMICCDDLQWGDETTLSLIREVLVNVSSLKHTSQHCLFVGLFRHDEVNDDHPFSTQYSYLQTMAHNINMTNIKLASLSKKDVEDMLKAELRLPHRLVVQLADVVHKKTSGHTLFVVELLNSLLRDSTIEYSPQYRRYSWDHDRIEMIPTGDGVAGLIASNVKSLPQASRRVLQILSCFGIQTDTSLLQILERFEEGIIASLGTFIEKGIIDRAGPIIMFSHDLIQQEVYSSLPLSERHTLHLEIGQCLGALANVGSSELIDPLSSCIDLIHIDNDREFFGGRGMTSSLISIACDQINSAGADTIEDSQRVKFSEWNRTSGQQAHRRHDWRASVFYFSNGLDFLGHECWQQEHERLCLDLYNGQVHSHASLGEHDDAIRCARMVVENTSFENALEAQRVMLQSYFHLGKHKECIRLGINILQQLKCDIPSDPTPESVAMAMSITDSLAANFSKDQIVNLCEKAVDGATYKFIKISGALYQSCFAKSSPLLQLMACITIQFSLQHGSGICLESTTAFAAYALVKTSLGDFRGGRWWADIAREVELKLRRINNSNTNIVTISSCVLTHAFDIWWRPLKETSKELFKLHHSCMRTGQTDVGVRCLVYGCRHSLFGGENLLLIHQSFEENTRLVAMHSKMMARLMALDGVLLTELTGKPGDYFSAFGGLICDVNDLQTWAESSDTGNMLQMVLCLNFFVAFWKGDYISAEQHLHKLLVLPASRTPAVILMYKTFFGGIVAFRLFRQAGGDRRFNQGKEMMDKVGNWAQISMDVFENKWHLIKAEYYASIGEHVSAWQSYEASINSARYCGNIHELALANELLASHCSACGSQSTMFDRALKDAYVYYTQWGATAVAERLLNKYDGDATAFKVDDAERPDARNSKHSS